MKTTIADIEQRVRIIKKRFDCELAIDWVSHRPRIERGDHTCYLSPRGTKTEIALWLDGFIEALDLNRRDVQQ